MRVAAHAWRLDLRRLDPAREADASHWQRHWRPFRCAAFVVHPQFTNPVSLPRCKDDGLPTVLDVGIGSGTLASAAGRHDLVLANLVAGLLAAGAGDLAARRGDGAGTIGAWSMKDEEGPVQEFAYASPGRAGKIPAFGFNRQEAPPMEQLLRMGFS